MKTSHTVGQEIKSRRNNQGLSIEALSEISGVSARTVQRIENGETTPRGHTLQVIAEALKCDITELTQSLSPAPLEDEKENVKWLNLSALVVMIIPATNLILPLILWMRYRKTELLMAVGGRILSFQILWTIFTAMGLILAPFIVRLFDPPPLNTTGSVIFTYVIFWFYNIASILNTAQKIQKEQWEKVHSKVIKLI
ncbi:helix-turn-helix domain-containing protein [Algoriphagus sp. SE2]|uniref:helix-turn-helix domain-containing protein n=1 Tax=Algoriphagus sp. SE2 TaxID=3141536 RepID=UPI0031CD78AF